MLSKKSNSIVLSKETAKYIQEDITNDFPEDNKPHVSVYIARPKREVPDFIIIFQALNRILSDELSPMACKILLYIYSIASYGNLAPLSIQTMVESFKKGRTTIFRAIKELMQYHIIVRTRRYNDKRTYEYMIVPYSAWKGEISQRNKALIIIQKQMKKFTEQLKLFKEVENKSMNNKKQLHR